MVTYTPVILERSVLRASTRFFESASFIGRIELKNGMITPITSACFTANASGKIDGSNPKSVVNKFV